MIFGADDVLEEANIVMAVFTAPLLYDFMYGFTQTAQNLFQKGIISDEAGLKAAIELIKENPKWMNAIEEQAIQRGITTEENLIINAQYVLDERTRQGRGNR